MLHNARLLRTEIIRITKQSSHTFKMKYAIALFAVLQLATYVHYLL